MIKGFRDFIMRGNVVDLAVGFVMGVAFSSVINAVVKGLITPLIAAIFGKPNLDSVATFTINGTPFSFGVVLTAVINFLLVAVAVYFVIVLPVNHLRARFGPEAAADGPTEVELLVEIRDALRSRG
jgi:large conductance mechanosensitive channel